MDGLVYRAIPLEDLVIEEVGWTDEQAEHIRTRTSRKGPGETDLEPEWATEAALDPFGELKAPNGDSNSLIVIGWSPSAQKVLKVCLIPV